MTLMGFKVNIETQSVPADYHSLSVLAMTNASRPVTIWVSYMRLTPLYVCVYMTFEVSHYWLTN